MYVSETVLTRGHNIFFFKKIRKVILNTPSYLEHCDTKLTNLPVIIIVDNVFQEED